MPSTPIKHLLLILFLAGFCLSTTACALSQTSPTAIATLPAQPAAPPSPPCSGPGCPNLVITQSGKVSQYNLSTRGIQAAAPLAQPALQTQNNRWTVDTGLPSPNGQWAAYTTIGSEIGGPVLLQDLSTGEWTNLIDALNARLPAGQPAFSPEAWWDVIGWFPDSLSLMIGPSDLSQVVIINLSTFAARPITFPGGGRGGRLFVSLAPDGSQFSYIGEDASGEQVLNAFDLRSGQTTPLLKVPYAEGVLYNPRFSPDHQQIAYLQQTGRPDADLTYALSLLAPGQPQPHVLVEGNLGITVPVWSPDGRQIAFTRNDGSQPAQVLPGAAPQAQASNIWVVSPVDGNPAQVTFLSGQARSPVWARDSQLLAFVTEDGQVQMVNTTQPGKTWQAAGPSADPALTSVFFMP